MTDYGFIPRIIHYCWFGGNEKPQSVKKCIDSWRLFLPDYQIIEWNESNFDVNQTAFTRDAYLHKKWAFVSDFARLQALHTLGGIYMDTDVEVLKPLDDLLNNELFLGFESNDFVMTAIIGSKANSPFLKELIAEYRIKQFIGENGEIIMEPNPYVFTKLLVRDGLIRNGKMQEIHGIRIYPQSHFGDNSLAQIFNRNRRINYIVHHCDQSWRDTNKRFYQTFIGRVRRYIVGKLRNIFGTYEISTFNSKILSGKTKGY